MTMTDERSIGGYQENPQHDDSSPQPGMPPENAGGDIATVAGQPPRAQGERERCDQPGCGKMILKKNMNHHKREVHGIYVRAKRGKSAVPPDQAKPEKEKVKPPTVDEIVAVVVQMRWPGHMPSSKVQALLEWRAATERFFGD
jgi:hypothetical protein